jgi:hypothetical protein
MSEFREEAGVPQRGSQRGTAERAAAEPRNVAARSTAPKRSRSAARASVNPKAVPIYRQLLSTVFTSSLGILAILGFGFYLMPGSTPSIIIVVIIAGALGAVFSSLVRFYEIEEIPAALVRNEMSGLKNLFLLTYSLVPIVVGAIAAIILFLVMASGLLSSPVFPEFSARQGADCGGIAGLIDCWSPASSVDFAKAIIWGFLSGFAERLVPNTLSQFASLGERKA